MGYADGYYYGQGRIICDTSTFSVGDTIRVRSMTDSNKVWNKQVATVGTALVFTVPPYDYYKICTVQDIGGVATEVGGVYKTVDYGQTYFVNVLDKSTLKGIKSILNAGNENDTLTIGDKVNITVSGNTWKMSIGAINHCSAHNVILVSDNVWQQSVWYTATSPYGIAYSDSTIYGVTNQFYNAISQEEQQYISTYNSSSWSGSWKTFTAKVWIPSRTEVTGYVNSGTPTYPLAQFPIFTTQANRVKTDTSDTLRNWWTRDLTSNGGNSVTMIETNGAENYYVYNTGNIYILPCFEVAADS